MANAVAIKRRTVKGSLKISEDEFILDYNGATLVIPNDGLTEISFFKDASGSVHINRWGRFSNQTPGPQSYYKLLIDCMHHNMEALKYNNIVGHLDQSFDSISFTTESDELRDWLKNIAARRKQLLTEQLNTIAYIVSEESLLKVA